MQAVIRAFELDDLVAPGGGAGQADGVHGRFRAAVAEAHISTGKRLQISSASSHSMSCGMPNMVPVLQALLDRLHHRRMAMSGHQRAEAQVVIDVFVAVEVAKFAALAFFHKDRIGIVSAVVAGDAQRNALEVLLVRFGGLRRAPLEGVEFFLQIGVHRWSPGKLRPDAAIRYARAAGAARAYLLEVEL